MLRADMRSLSDEKLSKLKRHILKWSADKAPAGNLSFTQICLTLNPAVKDLGGSPKHTRVAAIFHGGEDAKAVWQFAKSVMLDVCQIMSDGEIDVPISEEGTESVVTCKLKMALAGDEKLKFGANMHLGPGAYCGCWRCQLKTSKFLETSEPVLKAHGGATRRTVSSILLNGHMTVTDCCPGCGMAVVATRAEMERLNTGIKKKTLWKAIVVCTGDPAVDEPQPYIQKTFKDPVSGKRTTWVWTYRHKSIQYGGKGWQIMFPGVRLSLWVTCVLHLRQRTTSLNVKVGVCQWLDRDWNKTRKKKKGEAPGWLDGPQTMLLSGMFECFLPKGRKVPKLDTVSTMLKRQVSGRLLGLASWNWTGTASKLIAAFSGFLVEGALPELMCAESNEAQMNKNRSLALFQTHQEFMDLFCTRLDYGPDPSDLHIVDLRDEHAKKVEAAGKAYVEALKVLYPECRAFYPHCMARHCGDDIREHGCPVDYAQEGDEAKNLETKNVLMGSTNHQIETRLRTVMKHYAVLDTVSVAEPELTQHIERKHGQTQRRNATRKVTTQKQIAGKFTV